MGRTATVVGIAPQSIAAAYVATHFNNIMDLLQLVFAFVNAPLFATFLLGMFWRRTTGHGAFFGLLSGTLAAAVASRTDAAGRRGDRVKGGWLGSRCTLTRARWRRTSGPRSSPGPPAFVVTIVISLLTAPRPDPELTGLVYSLTERPRKTTWSGTSGRPFWQLSC